MEEFRKTYSKPESFLNLCNKLKKELNEDLKSLIGDKETKREMLSVLEQNARHICEKCNKQLLIELKKEKQDVNRRIQEVEHQLMLVNTFRPKAI